MDADLSIKLTAISGNPNLVLAYSRWNEYPTFDTADQVSDEISSFEEVIVLNEDLPE